MSREVPIQVEIYSSTEDELEALVLSNASREKTPLQKAREGMVLEEVEKARADIRKKAGVKIENLSDGSSLRLEKGKSSDAVAQKVGFKSGRQYERTRNVVLKIHPRNTEFFDDINGEEYEPDCVKRLTISLIFSFKPSPKVV